MKLTILQSMLIASGALLSGAATADVAAEATAFATQWATDAGIVGGTLIAAAFIAVGYKWVKGMVFN